MGAKERTVGQKICNNQFIPRIYRREHKIRPLNGDVHITVYVAV